jgi:hypothetical protein
MKKKQQKHYNQKTEKFTLDMKYDVYGPPLAKVGNIISVLLVRYHLARQSRKLIKS